MYQGLFGIHNLTTVEFIPNRNVTKLHVSTAPKRCICVKLQDFYIQTQDGNAGFMTNALPKTNSGDGR
jgi:hypothetical protein